mmetsp:Transcript_8564/g.27990  ORF Transcript_8564/g.27990 Transcript_8564/m.27990 type:complete len:245 (+) Transcript_8564:871-1605(+)
MPCMPRDAPRRPAPAEAVWRVRSGMPQRHRRRHGRPRSVSRLCRHRQVRGVEPAGWETCHRRRGERPRRIVVVLVPFDPCRGRRPVHAGVRMRVGARVGEGVGRQWPVQGDTSRDAQKVRRRCAWQRHGRYHPRASGRCCCLTKPRVHTVLRLRPRLLRRGLVVGRGRGGLGARGLRIRLGISLLLADVGRIGFLGAPAALPLYRCLLRRVTVPARVPTFGARRALQSLVLLRCCGRTRGLAVV